MNRSSKDWKGEEAPASSPGRSPEKFDWLRALLFLAAILLVALGAGITWLTARHPSAIRPQARRPHFGEVWEVYSFRSGVSATAYNSSSGNATIIWISGMDNEVPPAHTVSF